MKDPYAELLMDTARTPAVLGRRSVLSDERQLVYRRAGLQVDVMIQPGGPAAAFVWGRIHFATSGLPCEQAAVALLDDSSRQLARTETDEFGEFSFAAPRVFEGALAIETPAGRFLCWLAPVDAESFRVAPESRRA